MLKGLVDSLDVVNSDLNLNPGLYTAFDCFYTLKYIFNFNLKQAYIKGEAF